ncbi:leucyl aminopeptidase [Thiohalobacter sp.]|uniref:leucyl aminopeptidase n=1 Tax=Thiohalobacter sp. TaxID=2025948 RepID=UPI00260632AA|nr:leucyl aminopeptidase [Thiohalobacter sp.]
MKFTVKSGNPEKQRSACLVLGVFENRRLSAPARSVDKASHGFIGGVLRRGDLPGQPGQTLLLHNVPGVLADRVLLVGCGKEREFDETKFQTAVSAAARYLNDTGATEAVNCLTELPIKGRDLYWNLRQAVIATEDALYRFEQCKSEVQKVRKPLKRMTLSVPSRRNLDHGEAAVREGTAIAAGMNLAKDLGNLPGNICTPTYLADTARELARKSRKAKVTVLDEKAMEKLGMGALLSVARGSREPARLITLEYRGGRKDRKPVVLVGKGVTFDSGGISLKPGQSMDEMKFDMCGAASVLGTLRTVIELELPINVVGIIPATENLPDGQATKPGDIVTSMSGQTIEILNTDAEGRLILCDALTYAGRYEPDAVIDIATLTGACVIALGSHAAGLLTNHAPLGNELLNAGRAARDRAWELPLWDDYQQQLESNFADMQNIGGREAGTITAACFLSRFTRDYRWAHLDIAGVAWKQGKEKGATGRPVPLLTQYLLHKAGH